MQRAVRVEVDAGAKAGAAPEHRDGWALDFLGRYGDLAAQRVLE